MCFRRRREVDEDSDEDQHWVREQSDEPERKGNALTDECGDLGRAHITHARGENGA